MLKLAALSKQLRAVQKPQTVTVVVDTGPTPVTNYEKSNIILKKERREVDIREIIAKSVHYKDVISLASAGRDAPRKFTEEMYQDFLSRLASVGMPAKPVLPDKSVKERYNFKYFSGVSILPTNTSGGIKSTRKSKQAKGKSAKAPKVAQVSYLFAGKSDIKDERLNTITKNSVIVHEPEIQKGEACFEYVTLRKIFTEIASRDKNFVPEIEKNNSVAFIEAVHNTWTTKLRLEQTLRDIPTKQGPINAWVLPSKETSQIERFKIYERLWRESNGGYLVLVDVEQNSHIIQEARAFLLSKGKFYLQNQDQRLLGQGNWPDGWTFAPCPHDKPCPLLRPCRHQTSYLTSIEDIDLKFQVYSYVVFKIGKYRAQDLFDVYGVC